MRRAIGHVNGCVMACPTLHLGPIGPRDRHRSTTTRSWSRSASPLRAGEPARLHAFDEATAGLRFTGDVWAVPEGRIVFADDPILEVRAPIAHSQLLVTYVLNQLTFQTTIASKAARCVGAAR